MSRDFSKALLQSTLGLARRGQGLTGPNPMVGAVLVTSTGRIFQGFHPYYKGPHAEVVVLHQAGELSRGSQLYCSLEPCCHTGQGKHNPPCTQAIINAGVKQVVIGQLDPNPRVRGQGVRQLEQAGITVVLAEDSLDFIRLNPGFNTTHILNRPYIHLKAAITLDGQIARAPGTCTPITGTDARREVHTLRSIHDGVAVGIGTVLADDPGLDVRLGSGDNDGDTKECGTGARVCTQPLAVVFDRNLKIPLDCQLIKRRSSELVILTSPGQRDSPKAQELRSLDVRVLSATGGDLGSQLSTLPPLGIQSLLVEGGQGILTQLLEHDLWDELTLHIAPDILGQGLGLVGPLTKNLPDQKISFEDPYWSQIGHHGVFHGYRPHWSEQLLEKLSREVK